MQEVDTGGCKLPVARVAAQIPGIGPVTAREIAKAFGSVAEMVAADEKRWKEIDGIGPKTAKGAREFLNDHQK
jgi:ERCC4-type nuclease